MKTFTFHDKDGIHVGTIYETPSYNINHGWSKEEKLGMIVDYHLDHDCILTAVILVLVAMATHIFPDVKSLIITWAIVTAIYYFPKNIIKYKLFGVSGVCDC